MPPGSSWVDETGTIGGLAETIKLANKQIAEGATKRETLADNQWLYQSQISLRTIALYKQMIADHPKQSA
jgi:hypothetical protein